MTSTVDLHFPIFVFPANSAPGIVENAKTFAVWPVSAVNEGLRGMEIVDVSGQQFIVTDAQRVGYPKPFFGFSLLCERTCLVEFAVRKGDHRFSGPELKSRLPQDLASALAEHLDGEFDLDEANAAFASCVSVEDVFSAYRRYLRGEPPEQGSRTSP